MRDFFVFLLCFLLDRATKYIALSTLSLGVITPVASLQGVDVSWLLTTNEGAAWGFFDAFPQFLLFMRIVFVAILFMIYRKDTLLPAARIAIVIISAGACSNIVDTFVWGHVVDMIHVVLWGWDYPVFNVADICIFMGAVTFLFSSFSSAGRKEA